MTLEHPMCRCEAVPADPVEQAAYLIKKEAWKLVRVLESHRFASTDEAAFQAATESALRKGGITFIRELNYSKRDRVDFHVGSGIALELKVDGSVGTVVRQLRRYAEHDQVRAIVLLTTRAKLAAGLPLELNGKPVLCALQMGAF